MIKHISPALAAAFLFSVLTVTQACAAEAAQAEYSVAAPGNVTETAPSFHLVSGISKNTEHTFDESRSITGTAKSGSNIRVTVRPLEPASSAAVSFSVAVDASGIFSCSLPLEIGDNYVTVSCGAYEISCKITRINSNVKKSLESFIALP